MQALNLIDAIRNAFPEAIADLIEFRGERTLVVDSEKIAEIALFCRDADGLEFNYLSDMAFVDYYPKEPRFALCYHLYSMIYNRRLRLKVYLDGEAPRAPSVSSVWPSVTWQEREAFDMMGIQFDNHPDLRRILMPVDWIGHPLRKDYPLGYEQVQFSFNFDEIQRQKPYATE